MTLDDGTIIKAGQKLTPEEVKRVVVKEDLKFTAIHETIPAEVPDTGRMAENNNDGMASMIILPFVIASLGLGIYLINRKNHETYWG